nr:reverse transcriptase domain-containing protein [Tanacetum cinerariifolium]
MEELCQPSLNGPGGSIAPIAIQATNFGLKNDMIQQVQNSCQFHGLPGDDANKHLDKFLHVTQSIKLNGVTDDALYLYLFPHSLTHHAIAWFDRLPRNSINTFKKMAKMFLGKYFPPSMVTKLRNEITNFHQRPNESLFKAWERYKLSIDRCPNHNMLPATQIDTFYNGLTLRHQCYDLIVNMTAHHNDWDTLAQCSDSSSSNTSSFDTEIAALKAKMAEINKNIMRVLQVNQQVKAVTPSCKTCGGPHSFNDCPATGDSHGQNPPSAYQTPAYQAPGYQASVHQPQIPQHQVVTTNEFTNFMKANDAILKNMQTNMTSLTNSNLELKNMFGQFMKMNTGSSSGSGTLPGNTITNPKEELKGITTQSGTAYQGPTIPATSSSLPLIVKHETEATKDTVHPTNNGSTKDVQPSVFPTESPILNSEPVVTPIIEPVASPDLNFNISFDGALILMPKFGPYIKRLLTNKDKLCELARTPLDEHCSAVHLKKFPEKLGDFGKFLIPYFDADPRVPLILERSFLKTGRALIDVFEVELTLRVGKEAITFNLDQTSRYLANYIEMTANQIDLIDMACEEYLKEVLSFSDVITSGNPTPYYDLIVFETSSTLTPFRNSDFLLEEVDEFLALEDDPTLPKVDQSYVDTEGDILLLEAFLNDNPSLPLSNQRNYLLEVRKELKIYEAKSDKSSIDESLEVELNDLPPHLEYAFLEGDDKFPVIIVKDLSVKEKTALITVLKSHKRAIGWKLSDIKGIDPEFYTHKILMEEDFEPAVQYQRRVNPKIHDVIKNEVLKFLDAGLIYPISDSPWVSPVHYVPKKGGFTVVVNEENELILTGLVTGWRVCIDYQPFMVKEGIVLGHKIFKNGIEVDKAKVDFIAKLPHPTTVKGICSFLGHVGFYRRFIKDFSKIARPMTSLEKDTSFFFSKECIEAFQTLKRKLTEALILIAPDWDMPFELMCDASDFAIGAVLGQRQEKHFRPIHYASKTMTEA